MKKTISIMLALVLCIGLCACGSGDTPANQGNSAVPVPGAENTQEKKDGIPDISAAKVLKEGSCGETAEFQLYDNGVLVISGTGSVASDNPFGTYGDHLKYIRIEEGITDIEDRAFRDVDGFSIVELPSTLKTIGVYAFGECFGLKTINFPEGLVSIGSNAFCITSIESIELPSTISSIEEGTFSYNDRLKMVTIPGNVKTIGKGAFQDCDSLEVIILCDGVEVIEDNAFDGKGSRKMAIPDSVQMIGSDNIDYRTKIYCNDNSQAIYWAEAYRCDTIDTVVGYDGFVRNYDLP